MYLSRLFLNPISREVRRDLADAHEMHRSIMRAFPAGVPGEARMTHRVLHRLEAEPRVGRLLLYVQSLALPDWQALPGDYLLDLDGAAPNPATREIASLFEQLGEGALLSFRLRANPSRKIDTKSGPNGERRNGRRVELRGDAGRLDWLRRQGERCGFALRLAYGVADVRVIEEAKIRGARRERNAPVVAPALFEGTLLVTDPERFRQAVLEGIGPAKAYGCGLLSLAAGNRQLHEV